MTTDTDTDTDTDAVANIRQELRDFLIILNDLDDLDDQVDYLLVFAESFLVGIVDHQEA
tara:strand:+ start:510 stop:686 length:177 start_codon:yes stop_codon:yes gene_type:complete